MSPLRRLELRLLRECAREMQMIRAVSRFRSLTTYAWNKLENVATLAAEYRDLRDARKILNHFAENAGICEVCGLHCRYDGHAPGCALERVTR